MRKRSFDRAPSQPRPVKITTGFTKYAAGSVLIEYGDTKVLCTASVEETLPNWLRGKRGQGWITAEYSLLPSSTQERSRRERGNLGGRTQEIQRLIGRSLRGVVDLKQLGERTITIDCDVLQADAGTRTASITGGYVALQIAIDKLLKSRKLKSNPIRESVAAISVGMIGDDKLVDLDYEEDQHADADLNVVMTDSGQLLEVQGCAEQRPFSRGDLNELIELAAASLTDVFEEQKRACEIS